MASFLPYKYKTTNTTALASPIFTPGILNGINDSSIDSTIAIDDSIAMDTIFFTLSLIHLLYTFLLLIIYNTND